MQNPPTLVLFDIDLTLIRTGGTGRAALMATFEELTGVSCPEMIRPDGRTDPEIVRRMYQSAGLQLSDDQLASYFQRYVEILVRETASRGGGEVLPGVRALLNHLADRHDVHLGLLTGNLRASAKVKLEALGLWGYFPTGAFASDAEERPVIAGLAYQAAVDHFGITFSAAQTNVVGDSVWDVRAALVNGFRAVAVATGMTSKEDLQAEGPNVVLDSLEDREQFLHAVSLPLSQSEIQGGDQC